MKIKRQSFNGSLKTCIRCFANPESDTDWKVADKHKRLCVCMCVCSVIKTGGLTVQSIGDFTDRRGYLIMSVSQSQTSPTLNPHSTINSIIYRVAQIKIPRQ